MVQTAAHIIHALDQTEADVWKILPPFLSSLVIFQPSLTLPDAQLNLEIWCARNLELKQHIQTELNIIHSFRTIVNQLFE